MPGRSHNVWSLVAILVGPGASAAQDLAEIQKSGVLRVVVDGSSMPERFNLGSGAEPGLEKEILIGFASLHRLKLQVIVVDRVEDRLAYLRTGKADVVAGIVATESRRKLVDFTAPVLPNRHLVLTRKPDRVVSTLEDLRTRRVGAMKGSSWAEEARAAGVPPAQIDDSYPDPESLLEALSTGRVSAVVMTVVWGVLVQKKDPALQLGLFIGPSTNVAYAVRKQSTELWKSLDAYVSNLRQTATWSRLIVKYFGEGGLEMLKKARGD